MTKQLADALRWIRDEKPLRDQDGNFEPHPAFARRLKQYAIEALAEYDSRQSERSELLSQSDLVNKLRSFVHHKNGCSMRGCMEGCEHNFFSEAAARIQSLEDENARLRKYTIISEPDTQGAFIGDIWFGHPVKRAMGTHRWDGKSWQLLPDEVDVLLSMLTEEKEKNACLRADRIEELELSQQNIDGQIADAFRDGYKAASADSGPIDDEELLALIYKHFDEKTAKALYVTRWKDSIDVDRPTIAVKAFAAAIRALKSSPPAPSASVTGTHRPIETAPKDGTRILVQFKSPIPDDRPALRKWDGIPFVARHPGLADDGFDRGWNFAAPVGMGGFPDEWLVGWWPLPTPPSHARGE